MLASWFAACWSWRFAASWSWFAAAWGWLAASHFSFDTAHHVLETMLASWFAARSCFFASAAWSCIAASWCWCCTWCWCIAASWCWLAALRAVKLAVHGCKHAFELRAQLQLRTANRCFIAACRCWCFTAYRSWLATGILLTEQTSIGTGRDGCTSNYCQSNDQSTHFTNSQKTKSFVNRAVNILVTKPKWVSPVAINP